jgi:hypothetical protein
MRREKRAVLVWDFLGPEREFPNSVRAHYKMFAIFYQANYSARPNRVEVLTGRTDGLKTD